ncbi:glycoside hydrolase family 97 catalytic domain-containing protein [Halomarina ordinaria]|uniref:Glycoside hydrolase family 97 catalytic domain-containing protein n=1 Tax=Halomarina ordinaria TaxID=3033939 RepID=A0ABD5UGK1_9EURY|nr:glycoside hydrolase family 97 catalytic domain-containing protein [Halomarina sp. PSRA2]
MREKQSQQPFDGATRRTFLGGVAAVVAVAAYSRDVSADDAAPVANDADGPVQSVESPDGSITVTVDVGDGVPTYEIVRNGTTYVGPSALGFDFQNQPAFGASATDSDGSVTVTGAERETLTERWAPVWGAFDEVSADYNALSVGLADATEDGSGQSDDRATDGGEGRRNATLQIRVFDDGIGLRVILGEGFTSNSDRAVIVSENTGVDFADDYDAWWIRNEVTNPRFEQEYEGTVLSDIPGGTRETRPTSTSFRTGVHTPLTVDAGDAYVSVHESNLDDYAAATLAPRDSDGGTAFDTALTPLPDGTKASLELPAVTPWRTIQVVDRPGELIESQLVPLLADPLDESALPTAGGGADTSWIEPRKYVGIWWTMIAGTANWEYKSDDEIANEAGNPASYIHGARTERMKRYMRFASENGIDSVLAEGWNQGWATYPGDGTGFEFGVDDSYPDFDVREVTDYGAALSPPVEMTIHNETAGNVPNYESAILETDVFAGYDDAGINSIKNGYVSDPGLGIDGDGAEPTHNQHNQLAVNHHRLVIREAAAKRQLLEIHEGIKPTGEIRTYPNVANREVVKAQEYDGFGQLASNVGRGHHVTLPFTRNLAGPVSYQPGIFDITFGDDRGGQVQTTVAKQLAMYATYLSGLQMAADRIEAYVDETFEVGEGLQAAAGDRDGFVTDDTWRDAFGTNHVAIDPNRASSGSSVTFVVRNVDAAGRYDLHLRYASAPEENAGRVIDTGGPRATLRVNDETETIAPGFTAYWDDWQVFTTEIELDAGDNEIAIELDFEDGDDGFTGDVGGFNLNAVAVTPPGEPSPIPAEYEGYVPKRENFDAKPEFEFIEDVPAAGWDETRVVGSAIGEYLAIARRANEEWYVGVMTNGDARAVDVDLEFLVPGNAGDASGNSGSGQGNGNGRSGPKYLAEIYSDAIGAGVDADPTGVRIDEAVVAPTTTLLASMAPSGGTAVRLRPARGSEIGRLTRYERPEQELSVEIADEADLGEPFVTATGSNDAAFIGGTNVEVIVDGEREARANVRLPPNATDEMVDLGYRISTIGTFDVVVRDPETDEELAANTVAIAPGDVLAEFTDPQGDDDGPGEYVYPTDEAFEEGAFDLRTFRVLESDEQYRFAFEVENLYAGFGGEFSPHFFVVYLRNPKSDAGRTSELGDLDVTARFAEPWQHRISADGFGGGTIVDAEGNGLGAPETFVDAEANTAVLSIPKSVVDSDIADWRVLPLVGSADFGAFRAVDVDAGGFVFGGAREDAVVNAPHVIDLVTPEGTGQGEALSYGPDSLATLPFVSL